MSGSSGRSPGAYKDPLDYDSESDYQQPISINNKTHKSDFIDFQNDYEPIRLGLKPAEMLIVLQYRNKGKTFNHFISIESFLAGASMQMSISKSQSGSFKE